MIIFGKSVLAHQKDGCNIILQIKKRFFDRLFDKYATNINVLSKNTPFGATKSVQHLRFSCASRTIAADFIL